MDTLDKLDAFLKKRDGVDKAIKIMRYTAKLSSWALLDNVPDSDLGLRLKAFEASAGLSRKAYRAGKFLSGLNDLRHTTTHQSRMHLALACMSGGGDSAYYFLEQFVWLSKAGLLDKGLAGRLAKPSACLELIGYFGSISLSVVTVWDLLLEEGRLVEAIEGKGQAVLAASAAEHEQAAGEVAVVAAKGVRGGGSREELQGKLAAVRAKRFLKMLSLVQDTADGLLAVNELRDSRGRLGHPVILCSAALLSATISTWKNWQAL